MRNLRADRHPPSFPQDEYSRQDDPKPLSVHALEGDTPVNLRPARALPLLGPNRGGHRRDKQAIQRQISGRGVLTVHRSIEILIGRLVTDEEFRLAFQRDPRGALTHASAWGLELTRGEMSALLDTDHQLWDRVAQELDARLQKVSLRLPSEMGGVS